MKSPAKSPVVTVLAAALFCVGGAFSIPTAAADKPVKVRISIDEEPIVPALAKSLGYLKQEGIELERVKVEDLMKEDYLLQEPLTKGQIDASYHWFNHAVFGARHNLPIKGVMVFNDAPQMKVLVANKSKDKIKSPADFKGKNIAEGAGYGTKALLTTYLTTKAGLPEHSYTPVMVKHDGRQEAIIQGLKEGSVDIMTVQEPITSAVKGSGMVTELYDLYSKEGTAKVLGSGWPAQSLLMSPAYIDSHPDTVQHLVNAFVRTMRFINTHTADQIIAKLPPEFWQGQDKVAETKYIKAVLPSFAKGDYSFSPAEVQLVLDSVQKFSFDQSEEGKWRGSGPNNKIDPASLYTNKFVEKAMKDIK